MADKAITGLTAADPFDGSETFHTVQGGNSREGILPFWRIADSYDHSIDGDVTEVDFVDLAGAMDILVIARAITLASSGQLTLLASVDNGSSFYSTSGNYIALTDTGVESNAAGCEFYTTAATAARTGYVKLIAPNVNGVIKVIASPLRNPDANNRLFVASTAPINAVRCVPSGGGNITGGTIHCLVRK